MQLSTAFSSLSKHSRHDADQKKIKLRVARSFYMLTIMGLIGFILEFLSLSKELFVPSLRTAEISRCHTPLVSSRGAPRDSAILITCHYKDLGRASDWSCHWGNLLQPIRGCYSDLYSDISSVWNFCSRSEVVRKGSSDYVAKYRLF